MVCSPCFCTWQAFKLETVANSISDPVKRFDKNRSKENGGERKDPQKENRCRVDRI